MADLPPLILLRFQVELGPSQHRVPTKRALAGITDHLPPAQLLKNINGDKLLVSGEIEMQLSKERWPRDSGR